MKYCPMCKSPVNDREPVCNHCGFVLRDSVVPGHSRRSAPPAYGGGRGNVQGRSGQSSSQRRRNNPVLSANGLPVKIIAIACAAVVLIAAGITIYLVTRDKSGSDGSDSDTVSESSTVSEEPSSSTEPEALEDPISDVKYYVTGVSTQIKLYKSAGSGSPSAGRLNNKDCVLLLNTDDSLFWKVRTEDGAKSGYIDRHYLTDQEEAAVSPQKMTVSAADGLLLTEEDGFGEQLGTLENGDEVTVLAQYAGENWYVYSDALQTYGYVARDGLSSQERQDGGPGEASPAEPTPPRESAEEGTSEPGPEPAPQEGTSEPGPEPAPQEVQAEPAPPPAASAGTQETILGAGPAPQQNTYLTYFASVSSGYLALRNAKAYDASNELGHILNGQQVWVLSGYGETYWYVFSPDLAMYGYVNSEYLSSSGGVQGGPGNYKTVRVQSGYLALRSARAYDSANEIGRLNTGDRVQVLDTGDINYWYVYCPSLNLTGYVNKDYLF